MKRILVLCTGNSCRSQMVEGYLRFFHGENIEVFSAGIEVHGVNPLAIKVMKEDGVDISNHTSNHVDEYKEIDFDILITVCDHANEVCPILPIKIIRIHHSFPDPAKYIGTDLEILESFRNVRNEIKKYCQNFDKIISI